MAGRIVLLAGAASVLVSLGLACYLLFAPVSTSGLDVSGWEGQECGRPTLVLNDGTAYDGGELRPNQEEFDEACRRLSLERVRPAAVSGAAGLLALLPLGFAVNNLHQRARVRSAA